MEKEKTNNKNEWTENLISLEIDKNKIDKIKPDNLNKNYKKVYEWYIKHIDTFMSENRKKMSKKQFLDEMKLIEEELINVEIFLMWLRENKIILRNVKK